jgi:hypothetical protein
MLDRLLIAPGISRFPALSFDVLRLLEETLTGKHRGDRGNQHTGGKRDALRRLDQRQPERMNRARHTAAPLRRANRALTGVPLPAITPPACPT